MISPEQQILESIRGLPLDGRRRVLRAAINERLDQPAKNGLPGETAWREERFRKAQMWIYLHKDEYDGEFVLLEGDKLLGHGNDPKKLYRIARDLNIKSPYVTRIKAQEEPFCGSW